MMNDTSYQHYNMSMNNLFQCAGKYYAMSYDFKIGGMKGFYRMAKAESHERWKLADKIAKHIAMNQRKPVIDACPALSMNIPNPVEALKIMMQCENSLHGVVSKALADVTLNDPAEIYMLSKVYKKCLREYNEINGFQKRMALQGETVSSMDDYLCKKYKREWYGSYTDDKPVKIA